jgi:hypothetical protein
LNKDFLFNLNYKKNKKNDRINPAAAAAAAH